MQHVFRPFQLGPVTLKNRIFVPAHTTNFGEDFLPNERHVAYHRERARGGVGLIIVEPLRAHRTSLGRAFGLTGNDPAAIPGLRAITDAIHEEDCAAFVQITHAGRHGDNFVDRLPAWGPSSIPWTASGDIPHAMTRREMREVVAAYEQAAELAIQSGFDGIEIHFGHGHLLHQFLSPAANDRTDAYGGSFENRLRFPMEVLRAVLEAVASRVPVGVRLSVDDLTQGGLDPQASRAIAHAAATEPGTAFINASVAAYTWPSIGYHVADMSHGPHPYLDLTVQLRDAIGTLPLLTANRYTTLAEADAALATGAIDLIGMNRAHMADPAIIRKTRDGDADRIRPCVAMNYCIEQIALHRPITCTMNPRVGRETAWPDRPEPAPATKRLLVIGGGPAGMEFARVAAQRGHLVTLWERASELGGVLNLAGTAIGRQDLHRMRRYLESELRRTPAIVECRREATPESIAAHGPDAVILATGAIHSAPEFPGWEGVLTASDALALDRSHWRDAAVCLYDQSGGWASLSVAETLAGAGAQVTLVARPETVLWSVPVYSRMTALDRLRDREVFVLPRHEPVRAEAGTVTVREASLGRESLLGPFTDLVIAARGRSNLELAQALESAGLEVHPIGDASAPNALLQATFDGHALGRRI